MIIGVFSMFKSVVDLLELLSGIFALLMYVRRSRKNESEFALHGSIVSTSGKMSMVKQPVSLNKGFIDDENDVPLENLSTLPKEANNSFALVGSHYRPNTAADDGTDPQASLLMTRSERVAGAR